MMRLRPVLVATSFCAFLLFVPPLASRPSAQLRLSSRSFAEEAAQLQGVLRDTVLPGCPAQRGTTERVIDRLAKISADPLANESFESLDSRLSAARNEIGNLESRRDGLMKEVAAQQELEKQLRSRNVDAVLDALRTGTWLPIGDARTVLSRYVENPANTVQVGGVTLVMTPFGYFEYPPVVELNRSRASVSLVFHKLDFFDFGPVPAALHTGLVGGLQVNATYVEDSQSIAIEPDPQHSGVKDLTTMQTWRWTLTKRFRLFGSKSTGTFDLSTPDGNKGVARISNAVEVNSWLGAVWDFIKEVWDVFSIAFTILAFFVGKREWDTLIWRRLRKALHIGT